MNPRTKAAGVTPTVPHADGVLHCRLPRDRRQADDLLSYAGALSGNAEGMNRSAPGAPDKIAHARELCDKVSWVEALMFAQGWRADEQAAAKALGRAELVRQVSLTLASIQEDKFRRGG